MQDFLTIPLPPVAYDLIAVLVIIYFAWRGKRRGVIRELSSMISIGGSILLAQPLGSLLLPLFSTANLPEIIKTPIELSLGGLAAYLLLRISLFLIAKFSGLLKEREGTPQTLIHVGGALMGSVFGAFLVLALGWYTLSFGSLSSLLMQNPVLSGGTALASAAPESRQKESPGGMLNLLLLPTRITAAHEEAFALSLSGKIAARFNPIPEQILEGAEVMVDLTQHPEQMQKLAEFAPVQQLVEQPSIQELMGNPEVRALAEKGDITGLLNHPAVQEVMNDPAVQEALKGMDIEEMRKFLEEQK